jgi:hypothetical protein
MAQNGGSWRAVEVGGGCLLVVVIIVTVLAASGHGSLISGTIPTISGLSQFTVFYLMAQFVERVVEPFSTNESLFGVSQKSNGQNNGGNGGNGGKGDAPAGDPPNDKAKDDKANNNKANNDPTQVHRTMGLWLFASTLGIILCYATLGFFQMVQITFPGAGAYGHELDSVLSGVVVGSGTKPLHDLIGYIQDKNP